MNVDRAVLAFAGGVVLVSLLLAWSFSPYRCCWPRSRA
jgi:hypothetical protein